LSSPEELLDEIAETISRELEKCGEAAQKVLANLEVDENTYRALMVREVLREVMIAAQFAFPPHRNHTPEEVRAKALNLFHKNLERDKRLYLT
jgi:hypothetical protein